MKHWMLALLLCVLAVASASAQFDPEAIRKAAEEAAKKQAEKPKDDKPADEAPKPQTPPEPAAPAEVKPMPSVASPAGSVGAEVNSVFYAGRNGTRFVDGMELSDGTILIAGVTTDLKWLPSSADKIDVKAFNINAQPGGKNIAVLLHVSADLKKVLSVLHLPAGASDGFVKLKATSVPGEKTGELYISGLTNSVKQDPEGGYFIAKLDGNFVDKTPRGFEWVRNIYAANGTREATPFDVDGQGRVYYVTGEEFRPDWVGLYRLKSDGSDDTVANWRFHEYTRADGSKGSGHFVLADQPSGVTVNRSGIVFKLNRPDLRSWTQEEYDLVSDDGNGKTKKGKWPNDLFFSGPGAAENTPTDGPGYSGYRTGKNATGRVFAIKADRRTNDLYFGYCFQSKLPDGLPDFEPAVVAMTDDGSLKWWSRLYDDSQLSTPDQYVDHLDFDYAAKQLVVLARCHGNNVTNFWKGDGTFQQQFTGKNGNIHISWIGRLQGEDGKFINSTYLAEFTDNAKVGKPFEDGLLAGWPSPNAGWPDVNTTRTADLRVDASGRIYVAAMGRRVITTSNAYVQAPKPGDGSSSWADFARVYTPGLETLAYSTIFSAPWDKETGANASQIHLESIIPLSSGGFLVLGHHEIQTEKNLRDREEQAKKKKQPFDASKYPPVGAPLGLPMPTIAVPGWGEKAPEGETAVVGRIGY
jgi:hypothetical protein